MKWRVSFDWEPKGENILGVAFLVSLVWFGTTLLIHDGLKRALGLPADAGYRDGPEDMMAAVLLPFFCFVPLVLVSVLFGIESWWQRVSIARARVAYCALSVALLVWCWWSLQVNLSYGHGHSFQGYGAPTNTVDAAAYAATAFPIAVACACLLLAVARRPPDNVAEGKERQLYRASPSRRR